MSERKHVQHYYTQISGNTPLSKDLYDGEFAINMSKGDEQIFMKNTNDEIISFIPSYKTGNIVSEIDDGTYVDDVYAPLNNCNKITKTNRYSGVFDVFANETLHLLNKINDETVFNIKDNELNSDVTWVVRFIVDENVSPSITFTSSNDNLNIIWNTENIPILDRGYVHEIMFKKYENFILGTHSKFLM